VTDAPRLLEPTEPLRISERPGPAWVRPDGRRTLQLALATLWLFDGVLQMQAYFFTRAFGAQMITMSAEGNPSVIARSILWSGRTIGHHPVEVNALFALIQVGIGLGVAWRRSTKVALAVSVVWSLGVWWLGEGFGGVFSGAADPINGAPGAVILYALAAVLLWPSDRPGPRPPFIAGRAVGPAVAKALWSALWGSLAVFAVLGANRSAHGLQDLIKGQVGGEPRWVVWIDRNAADLVDHRGLGCAVALAVLLVVVAVGVYLPPAWANATLMLSMVLGLLFWVVGQDFGTLFTNGATDVNSGPLLILLGLVYWNGPGVAWTPPQQSAPPTVVGA
jgi:hypothetical protein